MPSVPHLNNPPMVEAILDVRVLFPKPIEVSALAALHDHFKEEYPKKNEIRKMEFSFDLGTASQSSTHDHGVQGHRFQTADDKRIIQVQRDGFSFHYLAPYPGWDKFITEAEKVWTVYRRAFPEGTLHRLAVRNINQIKIPWGENKKIDLEDYFKTPPPGPTDDELGQLSFLAHSLFIHKPSGFYVNWVLAHRPNPVPSSTPDPTHLVVALDLDVFKTDPQIEDHQLLETLNQMRALKDKLFLDGFTPKGMRMFD